MSKYIELTQGYRVLVDDEDFDYLNQWKWYAGGKKNLIYASRKVWVKGGNGSKIVFMHRLIMNAPKGLWVDHINRDKLDNRKINLRLCSPADNLRNTGLRVDNKSGYKGVHWHKSKQRWEAHIRENGKILFLGNFRTAKEGGIAYNEAAKKYYGEFAGLNVIEPILQERITPTDI